MNEESRVSRDLQDFPGRPRRLRAAGASLAAFLALAAPIDGADRLSAVETAARTLPDLPPGLGPLGPLGPLFAYDPLPSSLAGIPPSLAEDFDEAIWRLVLKSCDRFGIAEKALTMYGVLWEESRLDPEAESACGRYHGIGQFTRKTFGWAVDRMREKGLVPAGAKYSPYDPASAIEVMAFMWAEEMAPLWGPYRKVIRRLESEKRKVATKTN